jgi:hypothetical protein
VLQSHIIFLRLRVKNVDAAPPNLVEMHVNGKTIRNFTKLVTFLKFYLHYVENQAHAGSFGARAASRYGSGTVQKMQLRLRNTAWFRGCDFLR